MWSVNMLRVYLYWVLLDQLTGIVFPVIFKFDNFHVWPLEVECAIFLCVDYRDKSFKEHLELFAGFNLGLFELDFPPCFYVITSKGNLLTPWYLWLWSIPTLIRFVAISLGCFLLETHHYELSLLVKHDCCILNTSKELFELLETRIRLIKQIEPSPCIEFEEVYYMLAWHVRLEDGEVFLIGLMRFIILVIFTQVN